jgi:hypothetical protein
LAEVTMKLRSPESGDGLADRDREGGAVALLLMPNCLFKGVGPEQSVHAVQLVTPGLDQAGAG